MFWICIQEEAAKCWKNSGRLSPVSDAQWGRIAESGASSNQWWLSKHANRRGWRCCKWLTLVYTVDVRMWLFHILCWYYMFSELSFFTRRGWGVCLRLRVANFFWSLPWHAQKNPGPRPACAKKVWSPPWPMQKNSGPPLWKNIPLPHFGKKTGPPLWLPQLILPPPPYKQTASPPGKKW